MKTVVSTLALTMTAVVAIAQTAQLTIKSKESDIPIAVVQSFKQDFKSTSSDWIVVPPQLVGDKYMVSQYNNLNGEAPKSYSVLMRGPEVSGEALYNASGDLIYLKEHISNTMLPPAVTNAVSAKYPGYLISKDQETVKQGKNKLIHYKVSIQKGNDKRILAIDESGKILRERK
ncbi:hypothetical protein WBG78_03435 [Chryseolinea sp. T2]|uniref:hypothetical protein n=1 Tax=Chryseolinea sp. T2 TaxID=3129255 RepID=UPI00307768D9